MIQDPKKERKSRNFSVVVVMQTKNTEIVLRRSQRAVLFDVVADSKPVCYMQVGHVRSTIASRVPRFRTCEVLSGYGCLYRTISE
jgi:hypothetical protein